MIWHLKESFDNHKHKHCSLKDFEFFVIAPSTVLQWSCHHQLNFLYPLHQFLQKFKPHETHSWGFLFFNIVKVLQQKQKKKKIQMLVLISSPLNVQSCTNFIWIGLLARQMKHQRRLGFHLSYSFFFCKDHNCCYTN